MENISNDIIIYHIGSRLNNRFTKDNFRLTNTRYSTLIMPQSILNEKFESACRTNNKDDILEYRRKGALHMHEEIYNLCADKKEDLAKILWTQHNKGLGAFCIKSAFSYGIKQNNEAFITFLLKEGKPAYNSDALKNAIIKSRKLNCTEITQTLNSYIPPKPIRHCHRCGSSTCNVGEAPPL